MPGSKFIEQRREDFEEKIARFEEEGERQGRMDEGASTGNAVLEVKDDTSSRGGVGAVRVGDEPIIEYWHVTSRIHLKRFLLKRDELKEILLKECQHYARVCGIALLHYCIMDNHFHLVVGLTKKSHRLTKMVGCIKQQFTNKFKTWFNTVYRPEDRYRKTELGNGTLWEGPSKPKKIETDAQLEACTLYVENNRLVVVCKDEIGALEQTPCFILDEDCDIPEFKLQPIYKDLLARMKSFPFQSACYYLGAVSAAETYLTNGQDGVWASNGEVDSSFKVAKEKLPEGWRKVWFKECPGILKPTADEERKYARNPFYEGLGSTGALRAAHFGRYLLGSCFKQREKIAKMERPD